ncbi:hypothetical protein AB1Y20_011678 [Prymnesium parvum]|uniref:Glucose-6-phosphate 1-dehydrogenase n=1 Tax=Prymnesium parvum TaxID=97485 RepID=A0AB34IJT8_PRYPA
MIPFSAASVRKNASWSASKHKTPTEDCSDSDGDESRIGTDSSTYSPVPRGQFSTAVVFGSDGNLASKKILPTLFKLWKRRMVPRDLLVVGYARAPLTTEQFRKQVFRSIYDPRQPQAERKEFQARCFYASGPFGDLEATRGLVRLLRALEARRVEERSVTGASKEAADAANETVRLYYMAVPPFLYADICSALRTCRAEAFDAAPADADKDALWPVERFVLEKPFGRDSASCAALFSQLSMVSEEETFRIDHYLGKELVLNLLVLRFANVCFQSIWNRAHVKAVQVIFKEDFGTDGRGGYFDEYGIIRDVMQNHLLQVMALVAMEQPLSFGAEHIRTEKLKVLQACKVLTLDDVVVGQYTGCGGHKGYLEDPSITNKESTTETFATAVLHIHSPRWDGVPFILKAGKAVTDRKAEVRIQFHTIPGAVSALMDCAANELVVRLQPEESIYWKVINKVPGLKFEVQQMRMDLLYSSKFDGDAKPMPEAYERLLLEVLANDHSHFVSADELIESWRIFTPLLHTLKEGKIKPHPYPFGSRGPPAADALAHKYGMSKFGGGITPYVEGQPARKYVQAHNSESLLGFEDEGSEAASIASSQAISAAEAILGAARAEVVGAPKLGPPPSAVGLAAASTYGTAPPSAPLPPSVAIPSPPSAKREVPPPSAPLPQSAAIPSPPTAKREVPPQSAAIPSPPTAKREVPPQSAAIPSPPTARREVPPQSATISSPPTSRREVPPQSAAIPSPTTSRREVPPPAAKPVTPGKARAEDEVSAALAALAVGSPARAARADAPANPSRAHEKDVQHVSGK